MNVLVTGATGFVGSNLVERIDDATVTAVVRDSSPVERLPDGTETVRGDVTDRESIEDAIAASDCDALVHLAAVYEGYFENADIDDDVYRKVNVGGTRNVVDAANELGVKRVVFTSSIGVHPERRTVERTEYFETKREATALFREGDHDFEYSVLYPTYIIGPKDFRLSRFVPYDAVQSNLVVFPPMFPAGRMNLVHVHEVADTIVEQLRGETEEDCVVSSRNVPRSEYYREIASIADGRHRVADVPYSKRLLPGVIDVAHRAGLLPAGSEYFTFETDTGIVPSRFENRGARTHTWRDAVRDSYEWYRSVGVL